MKAANDSNIQRKATLYCNFHLISGKQSKFKKAGLGKYIRSRSASSEKGKYIHRVYVMVKSIAYLPVELSKSLVSYILIQLNCDEYIQLLGLDDHKALTGVLESLEKDIRCNGPNMSWFDELTRNNIWLDMTSNSG